MNALGAQAIVNSFDASFLAGRSRPTILAGSLLASTRPLSHSYLRSCELATKRTRALPCAVHVMGALERCVHR